MLRILKWLRDWSLFDPGMTTSKHDMVSHYVSKLAILGIVPDGQTSKLLRELTYRLPVGFYVDLMYSMNSAEELERAVDYVHRQVADNKVLLQSIVKATADGDLGDKIRKSFEEWITWIVQQPTWNIPNPHIFDFLVNELRVEIQPDFCVAMVKIADSLDAVRFILEDMLFKKIERSSFVNFDVDHNNTITTHIRQIQPLNESWLYAFQLNYVGCGGCMLSR